MGANDPRSLLDGYLIAHGMARSYVMSGRASRESLGTLIQYDRTALLAVAADQVEPSGTHANQAEQALQRLVEYTGQQDLRTPQLPPLGPPPGMGPQGAAPSGGVGAPQPPG